MLPSSSAAALRRRDTLLTCVERRLSVSVFSCSRIKRWFMNLWVARRAKRRFTKKACDGNNMQMVQRRQEGFATSKMIDGAGESVLGG